MADKVELLAPAGNYDAFLGALHAGADAVYLGGSRFGARAYADNFDKKQIVRALRVAHFYGKKIYLTVNTLLKERELAELCAYLAPFYEAGLDGVIVQDFGVLWHIRKHFPGLPLHVSTQMAVTGAGGAALLKEQGASRIVPARELSLGEVIKIKEEAGVEVECFIHGAMCYSYSGQCLFSSILGGRSGNRGRCAQPCRLPYEIYDGKERLFAPGHPLSLKDMCTLAYLPALLEAGIDSFKIEGRMKRPEYAAGVTAVYRKYIDRYYKEGASGYRVESDDMDRLKKLYIRSEIQTGYYERHNGKEMITPGEPGYVGCDETLLTEIRETYIKEPEKMPVRMQAQVKPGEPLRLRIMEEEGALQESRKVNSEAGGADGGEPERKDRYVPAKGCRAKKRCLVAEVSGDEAEPAKNAPLSEADVRKRLSKTGDSLLRVTACEISMEGDCFVPVRALNELRRAAVEAFEAAVAKSRGINLRQRTGFCLENGSDYEKAEYRPSQSTINTVYIEADMEKAAAETKETKQHVRKQAGGGPAVDVTVSAFSQCRAALAWGGCRRIYIESGLFLESGEEIMGLAGEAVGQDDASAAVFYVALPFILRERDNAYLKRLEAALKRAGAFVKGFLIRNLEGLSWARGAFFGREGGLAAYELVADAGLYCFNASAAQWLSSFAGEITLPYELNAAEAAGLSRAAGACGMGVSLIVYSRIPMMITANCLQKTADLCSSGNERRRQLFLKDRKGAAFPVVINCENCYNVIYNSVPYSLHNAKKERERVGAEAFRYDFVTEDESQCRRILEGDFPFTDYTAGHCKRGVE